MTDSPPQRTRRGGGRRLTLLQIEKFLAQRRYVLFLVGMGFIIGVGAAVGIDSAWQWAVAFIFIVGSEYLDRRKTARERAAAQVDEESAS